MVRGNVFGLKRGGTSSTSFDEVADEPLLVLAPPASLSGSLLRALEQCFGEVAIIQANQIDFDRSLLQPRARDVFLSAEYSYMVDNVLSNITKFLPGSRVTLIYNGHQYSTKEIFLRIPTEDFDNIVNVDHRFYLITSIFRIISSGGEYICPELTKYSIMEKQDFNDYGDDIGESSVRVTTSNAIPSKTLKGLTRRELEILERVAYGYRNRAIAEELYLSEHTVKVHLRNIIKKLGAYNRTNAAALFHLRHDERKD